MILFIFIFVKKVLFISICETDLGFDNNKTKFKTNNLS